MIHRASGIFLVGVVATLPVLAQFRIDDFRLYRNHQRSPIYSYQAESPATPLPRRAPTAAEQQAVAYAERLFDGTEARAMMLIDRGQVVWERIKAPAHAYSPFHGYSVTKSILSVGIGRAVCAGVLTLDDKLGDSVPTFSPTALGRASVRDLLMMASGVTSSEVSGSIPALVRAVDFGGPEDIEEALLAGDTARARRGLLGPFVAGERFDYKNTDPEALGLLLHRRTGRSAAHWLTESVIRPAGIEGPVYMGQDRSGHTNTSYGMRMPLEDWGRLAIWIKAQSTLSGCLGDYLRTAMSRQIRNTERRSGSFAGGYGYLFWTDIQGAPGSVWAFGYAGQRIAWDPASDRILIIFSTFENWSAEGFRLFDLWRRAGTD